MAEYRSISSNKRNNIRIPINVTGKLVSNGKAEKCEIIDISKEGIGLKVRQFFQENDRFEIIFELSENINVSGSVNVVYANGSRIGGIVNGLTKNMKDAINSFVDRKTSSLKGFFR